MTAAALTLVGIWVLGCTWLTSRDGRALLIAGTAGLCLLAICLQYAESLGRAKPVWLEWRTDLRVPVVAHYLDEHAGKIYVWLFVAGEPRAYVLGWDRRLAEELQRTGQAVAEGEQLEREIIAPFSRTEPEGERVQHPDPAEALPPKAQ